MKSYTIDSKLHFILMIFTDLPIKHLLHVKTNSCKTLFSIPPFPIQIELLKSELFRRLRY